MRRLLVARRIVPLDLLEEYLAAWSRLVAEAGSLGARAWLFRGVGHEDHFTEFLEWDGHSSFSPDAGPVAAVRSALDAFGHPHIEALEEAT
jgi:hypothetical protein